MSALAVTDSANNTGATATVTGTGGAAVAVYAQPVDGTLGAGAWALAGSRTGDGTVALALAKGYYFGYALVAGAASNLVYFQVTDGADSVLSRCVAAVKAQVHLLNLPCTQRVFDSLYEQVPLTQVPCTVLTTEGARETVESALNGRDDVGRPVRLIVRDLCLAFDEAKRETYRRWRQALYRAFQSQRLPGVPESVRNKVEVSEVTPAPRREPQMVIEMVVRCVTREVRGLGA